MEQLMPTLKEVLNTLDPHEIVSIGSSSSYVYIGEAGDIDFINRVFKDIKRDWERQQKEFNKQLRNYAMSGVGREDEGRIKARMTYIKQTCNSLRGVEERLNNYKDPLKRRIRDQYDRIDGTKVILVEGDEVGTFWDKDEFDAVYGEKL